MRENRTSGSEGGETEINRSSLPLSGLQDHSDSPCMNPFGILVEGDEFTSTDKVKLLSLPALFFGTSEGGNQFCLSAAVKGSQPWLFIA